MSETLTLADYKNGSPKTEAFCVVNREHLLAMLDLIVQGRAAEANVKDVAEKIHFGLVHGLGSVKDLVEQAKEEERERCAALAADDGNECHSECRPKDDEHCNACIVSRIRALPSEGDPRG